MNPEHLKLSPRCPIRTTLEMLGGKWKLLLIYQLSQGPLRFSELKERIPAISEKMLYQELRSLMESRLVERTEYKETPLRVEYALTEQGCLALPLIKEMRDFAIRYEAAIVHHK